MLGIFQHVWVKQFPAVHPRTHLVLRVRGRHDDIGNHPVTIRLLDPDGQPIMGGDGTLQFGEPPAGVTEVEASAVLVFDVPLPRPGRYHFEISLGPGPGLRLPLGVSLAVPHRELH